MATLTFSNYNLKNQYRYCIFRLHVVHTIRNIDCTTPANQEGGGGIALTTESETESETSHKKWWGGAFRRSRQCACPPCDCYKTCPVYFPSYQSSLPNRRVEQKGVRRPLRQQLRPGPAPKLLRPPCQFTCQLSREVGESGRNLHKICSRCSYSPGQLFRLPYCRAYKGRSQNNLHAHPSPPPDGNFFSGGGSPSNQSVFVDELTITNS